jgi:hypothetical protein
VRLVVNGDSGKEHRLQNEIGLGIDRMHKDGKIFTAPDLMKTLMSLQNHQNNLVQTLM